MNWEVKHIHEHYEIYINGDFYCAVDSLVEVDEEIEKFL